MRFVRRRRYDCNSCAGFAAPCLYLELNDLYGDLVVIRLLFGSTRPAHISERPAVGAIMSNHTCAVVTAIGPGHEAAYEDCSQSIQRAFKSAGGGFSNLLALRMDDPEGNLGSARARNLAIEAAASHGADWILFIDADDLLSEHAFREAKPYLENHDAIWGQVYTFQDGSNEAFKRDPQVEQAETIAQLLKHQPEMSLQTGHFMKTEIAQQFLFDESIQGGSEFDQYLRVWEQCRCAKIPHPISFKRLTGEPRPRAAAEKKVLTHYRIKHGITQGTAPQAEDYRMDFAFYGLIGCGTREIAQLLTIPHQRIILDEPAIFGQEWARNLQEQLQQNGIVIADRDWARNNYLTFQEFFDVQILPRLAELSAWGTRTTRFDGWQESLDTYPPEKLVLCVRDMRDVVLSHVDIALRLGIPIDGAFIEHRTLTSAAALMEMQSLPHCLIRYEDLAVAGGFQHLAEKLEIEISEAAQRIPSSSGPAYRYQQEHRPELVEFVNRIWRQTGDYCQLFGYELPEESSYGQVA